MHAQVATLAGMRMQRDAAAYELQTWLEVKPVLL